MPTASVVLPGGKKVEVDIGGPHEIQVRDIVKTTFAAYPDMWLYEHDPEKNTYQFMEGDWKVRGDKTYYLRPISGGVATSSSSTPAPTPHDGNSFTASFMRKSSTPR